MARSTYCEVHSWWEILAQGTSSPPIPHTLAGRTYSEVLEWRQIVAAHTQHYRMQGQLTNTIFRLAGKLTLNYMAHQGRHEEGAGRARKCFFYTPYTGWEDVPWSAFHWVGRLLVYSREEGAGLMLQTGWGSHSSGSTVLFPSCSPIQCQQQQLLYLTQPAKSMTA